MLYHPVLERQAGRAPVPGPRRLGSKRVSSSCDNASFSLNAIRLGAVFPGIFGVHEGRNLGGWANNDLVCALFCSKSTIDD
jgi:hypothetical protein